MTSFINLVWIYIYIVLHLENHHHTVTIMSIVLDTGTPTFAVKPVRTYPATTLLPPTRSHFRGVELEYAICAPTSRFQRELANVFPARDLNTLRVVPVIQRCENDLVGVGAAVDREKEEMLERVS